MRFRSMPLFVHFVGFACWGFFGLLIFLGGGLGPKKTDAGEAKKGAKIGGFYLS